MKKIKNPREIGDYIIDEGMLLGRGSYGKIYAAYKKDMDVKIACKSISKKKLHGLASYDNSEREVVREMQAELEREIHFHYKLSSNKHIVQLYGMEQDELAYYLFMEYCDSDLGKLLQNRGKLPEEDALDFIRQLCRGYNCIYRNNASHRDLKPENLLLKKGLLKIADFGFVKEITNLTDSVSRSKMKHLIKDKELLRASTLCGTPQYIPPNVIEAQTRSELTYDPEKFDMWSIGIILYFMLYGVRPFTGANEEKLYEAIQKKEVVFPEAPVVSARTKSLILKLLNKDEEQRIDFKQLLKEMEVDTSEVKQLESQRNSLSSNNSEAKFEAKLRYLQFLSETMRMLYALNTKFSFFKKHFKKVQFAYQLMTRLHELRLSKVTYVESLEGFDQMSQDFMGRFGKVKEGIEEYDRVFYQFVRTMSANIEGGFGSVEMLLKKLADTVVTISASDLDASDFELRKCLLALLRLKHFLEKKAKSDKLSEVLEMAAGTGFNLTECLLKELTG